jgi:hypothetical protein
VLSKRVMVIAAEKALQKRLTAGAMAAGASAQAYASLVEAPAHLECDLLLCEIGSRDPGVVPAMPSWLGSLIARLPGEAQLVPIIPMPDLEWMVALVADGRVPCVLTADGLSATSATATISKLLTRDLFGIEKVMPWGVRVYAALISDYQEKTHAIASIGDFAQAMGVRRKYREQIDQCLDEMLMNALYDAPVDSEGRQVFADVPVKERVLMRADEKAVLQYACDGDRFAISVRDAFGSLRKETILQYLDKCLHASEQIDRKAGGAGLGLYLMCNSATEVSFHVFTGSATEVICAFDLTQPRTQLRALGIFEEHLEGAHHPTTPATMVLTRRGRRREDLSPAPPPPSGVLLPVMMTFAVLLLLFSAAVAAWPYFHKPVLATLRIDSDPAGARVYVDGRRRGATPLKLDGLEAGRSYAVRAVLAGWRDDEQLVTAAAGESTVRLHLAEERGVVVIESEPPGAHLFVDGHDSGQVTPATVEVAPGARAKAVLRKDGFLEQPLALVGPNGGERAVYRATLPLSPQAALLTITSDPASANVSVDGLTLAPPAPAHDTFVAPGVKHKLKATANGYVDGRAEVVVGGGEHKTVHLELVAGGTITLKTNVAAKVIIDGASVGTSPIAPIGLTPGEHTLVLRRQSPPLEWTTKLHLPKGESLEIRLDFTSDHKVTGHVGAFTVDETW